MKTILTFLIVLATAFSASASKYTLNEAELDLAFEQSDDVSYYMSNDACVADYAALNAAGDKAKSQTTAAIIAFVVVIGGSTIASIIYGVISAVTLGVGALFCWPIYFLPLLPFHRFYLGTGGNHGKIGALYCITLSWLFWLPIIDGVMLLIDDTDSKYIDNPNYIMWIDK